MNIVFLIGSSVINEELSDLLSGFERKFEIVFESFEDREVILKVLFFSP